MRLILQVCSGLHRRVNAQVQAYPHRLLELIRLPPLTFCPARQKIAQELCQTESSKLECTARKFKLLHMKELMHLVPDSCSVFTARV